MVKTKIPEVVREIGEKLNKAGFEAYLVGGCVRDILRGIVHGELVEPKDWDVATDAKPDEIQKIFPDSVYENDFGTVLVKIETENSKLKTVEITTYRLEGKYSDRRHPDEIKFAKTIEEDLSRRDFTINAIALEFPITNFQFSKLIDPFGGETDLKNRIVRTVGNPEKRFEEDALRLMRAVRFAVELNFNIEKETQEAIKKHAKLLADIARERIRDEFEKIIMTPSAKRGIELLEELNLLRYIIPELREGIGIAQNRHHIYTVFEHALRSLDYTVKQNYSLEIRIAALFHDIAKPKTKRGEGPDATFYNHEQAGARVVAKILERMRFSKEKTEKILHLVRYHMFYYNVDEVSAAGVRRFLSRVGPENVDDFIKLREADRIGSGVPKAVPYKLRHLLFMIDKVKRDPISPKMLKVKGEDVMKIAGIEPGPKVGQILAVLLEEVLDEPEKNSNEYLVMRIEELAKLPEKKLLEMMKKAKEKKDEFETGEIDEIKKKHYVK